MGGLRSQHHRPPQRNSTLLAQETGKVIMVHQPWGLEGLRAFLKIYKENVQ